MGKVKQKFQDRAKALNKSLNDIAQKIHDLSEEDAKKLLEQEMGTIFAEMYIHGKSNNLYGKSSVQNMIEDFLLELFSSRR